jgi:hypothetical protein
MANAELDNRLGDPIEIGKYCGKVKATLVLEQQALVPA